MKTSRFTVSYFEWVKNLSHIPFGRMQRRHDEARNQLPMRELDKPVAANGLKWTSEAEFGEAFLRAAGELELVRSGLDDTHALCISGDARALA